MTCYRKFDTTSLRDMPGRQSCVLLDADTGCVGECLAGVSVYHAREFAVPEAHDFQEGFYVIEGEGFALVGGEEFPVAAGTSFLVPAGQPHAIRRKDGSDGVKVFWFHSE